MTALGSTRGQPPIAQRRAGILGHTGTFGRKEIAESSGVSQEGAVLRRPQDQDEYWSISPSAWLQTSKPRRMVLSHVGRINETSEGEQAVDGDCTACAKSGAECMVYRHEVRVRSDDTSGGACGRCRFRGSKCSFDTIEKPGRSKRKRANYDDAGCNQTRRSSPRQLRGSNIVSDSSSHSDKYSR